jgi:hypothetical protein
MTLAWGETQQQQQQQQQASRLTALAEQLMYEVSAQPVDRLEVTGAAEHAPATC